MFLCFALGVPVRTRHPDPLLPTLFGAQVVLLPTHSPSQLLPFRFTSSRPATSAHPIISIPAPTHHSGGSFSPNTIHPAAAATMKFVEVFSTLTCTVLRARVSARVNRPHISASNARLRAKKAARTSISKGRDQDSGRARMPARDEAREDVRDVVVLEIRVR